SRCGAGAARTDECPVRRPQALQCRDAGRRPVPGRAGAIGAGVTNPVLRSFELAAERCEDLTPLVYARLHREHPETPAMFRTQGSDLVKGSMLALTTEAILDF